MMEEIRFHGRGGQGTVVASIILAKALFRAGYYVQSFPVFGVERRGAPVEAYLRLDREKVLIRCNVYTPDHVIVQDMKLLKTTDVTRGLKPGGSLLFNSPEIKDTENRFSAWNIHHVDATHIALKNGLGTRTHPIVNTAMTGAFARIYGNPPLEVLAEVIRNEIPIKTEQNIRAAEQAYELAGACLSFTRG